MDKVRSKRTPDRTKQKTAKARTPKREIAKDDLARLAKASRAHEWLREPDEDIYDMNDGKPASF